MTNPADDLLHRPEPLPSRADWLVHAVRTHIPNLQDDGFTAAVLARLPARLQAGVPAGFPAETQAGNAVRVSRTMMNSQRRHRDWIVWAATGIGFAVSLAQVPASDLLIGLAQILSEPLIAAGALAAAGCACGTLVWLREDF